MPNDKRKCEHQNFLARVNVSKLEDTERFQADVRIRCEDCNLPFQFIGLPAGLDLDGAATSANACEGRFAIAPKGEVLSAVEGAAMGFSIRRRKP